MDLALNNLERLICHKTQTNKQTNKQSTVFSSPSQPDMASCFEEEVTHTHARIDTHTRARVFECKIYTCIHSHTHTHGVSTHTIAHGYTRPHTQTHARAHTHAHTFTHMHTHREDIMIINAQKHTFSFANTHVHTRESPRRSS